MPCQDLHDVTRATTLARMLYASPAWWGLLNESDLNRLENFLRRARRGGFLSDDAPTFKTMAARADPTFFAWGNNQQSTPTPTPYTPCTCLEHTAITYNLRPRSHPFELPDSDSRNFLPPAAETWRRVWRGRK